MSLMTIYSDTPINRNRYIPSRPCFVHENVLPTGCTLQKKEKKKKKKVKSGNFGHHINSDIHLETVTIRLIRIFTVCLVNSFDLKQTRLLMLEVT